MYNPGNDFTSPQPHMMNDGPGLRLNVMALSHLTQAAKWARFLAIVGFVSLALGLLVFAFLGFGMGSLTPTGSMDGDTGMTAGSRYGVAAMMGGSMIFGYLFIAAIYILPILWLYQFGSKAKAAVQSMSEALLAESFQRLKQFYQYISILVIILLVLYTILILLVGLTYGIVSSNG